MYLCQICSTVNKNNIIHKNIINIICAKIITCSRGSMGYSYVEHESQGAHVLSGLTPVDTGSRRSSLAMMLT